MTKIIQRHDTAANWTAANPVLALGEMGVETDTNKFKFGDGSTAWADLAYAASGSGGGGEYTLPIASTTTLGGVKVGDNLSISEDGTLIYGKEVFDQSKYTVIGSPTITSEGIASGFDVNNYLTIPLPNLAAANSWEIHGKFTTGPNLSDNTLGQEAIFGSDTNNQIVQLQIIVNNQDTNFKKLSFGIGDGSSWIVTVYTDTLMEVNTIYYYKLIFTGTSYEIQLSTDGITYSRKAFIENSSKIGHSSSSVIRIGKNRFAQYNASWQGTIDLSKFKIIADEKVVFTGSKILTPGTTITSSDGATMYSELALGDMFSVVDTSTKKLNGVTQTGGTLNSELEFTGASGAYLKMNNKYALSSATSWQFQIKYKHKGGGSSPTIFGYASGSDYKTPALILEGGSLRLYLSSTGSSWNLNSSNSGLSPVAGTTYYLKVGFDGSQYYIKYNTTGWADTFITQWTKSSTTKVYCSDYFMLMNLSLNNSYYNTGTMYLEDTSLIVDGAEVWRGANVIPGRMTLNANDNKYTIVGSPVITPDGVASGFRQGNYVSVPMPNFSTATTWSIEGQFNLGDTYNTNHADIISSAATAQVLSLQLLAVSSSNTLPGKLSLNFGDGTSWKGNVVYDNQLSLNTDYYYRLVDDGSSICVYLSTDNINFEKVITYTTYLKLPYSSSYNIFIGIGRTGISQNFLGTINLSNFRITIDGIKVFDGSSLYNKFTILADSVNTNKNEISELASNKQDKLTAVAPISIYDYKPDYTYVGYTKDENNNLTKDNNSEHYILMPYNKNYLYKGYCKPDGNSNNTYNMRMFLGKIKEDDSFQQIAYAECQKMYIKLTDNAEWSTLATYSATGGNYNMGSNTLTFMQCYIDGTNVKVNTPFPFYGAAQSSNASFTVSSEAATRLAEITHVQYLNNSTAYPIIPGGSLGYYDIGGFVNTTVTNETIRKNIINDKYPDTYPNLFKYIANGIIHRIEAVPATNSSLGVVQPDGTSITISDAGVISGQDVKTFTGYSDTGTLVLKSINGVLQWVAEA